MGGKSSKRMYLQAPFGFNSLLCYWTTPTSAQCLFLALLSDHSWGAQGTARVPGIKRELTACKASSHSLTPVTAYPPEHCSIRTQISLPPFTNGLTGNQIMLSGERDLFQLYKDGKDSNQLRRVPESLSTLIAVTFLVPRKNYIRA